MPCWASEIEPYPIAVTRSRFPTMKHLGDISKINGAEIEPVDVITFGSPCQDLSVAGKRAGLEGARSGLFMEAVRIIKEMREATNGQYPTFALWENVPGAFSSNKGEDFRIVLEELIKIAEPSAVMPEVPPFGWAYADSFVGDGWSLAYRVFDTQYWPGTPQRRRRIHLIADLRGQRAREVLFEREGLRGYLAESPAPRERITAYVEVGSGAADQTAWGLTTKGNGDAFLSKDRHTSLSTGGGQAGQGYPAAVIAVATQQGGAEIADNGICPTVTAAAGMSGNNQPWICQSETAIIDNIGGQAEYGKMSEVNGTLRAGAQGAIVYCYDARGNGDGGTANTITGDHENRVTDYTSVVVEPVAYNGENITNPLNKTNPKPGDPCHTLGTDVRNYLVQAYGISSYDSNAMKSNNPHSGIYEAKTSRTLDLNGGNPACNQGGIAVVESVAQLASGADVAGCLMASGYEKLGAQEMFSGDYTVVESQRPMVTYATDVGFFNSTENISPSLLARGYKDPHLVTYPGEAVRYIVRRLTPTECARLQGFSDKWGHPEQKDDFTEDEYQFWMEVRNTHAAINGKTVKEYTKEQMLKWYSKLHSDSAEYKMWGNGIALPPALYCMQGIAEAMNNG